MQALSKKPRREKLLAKTSIHLNGYVARVVRPQYLALLEAAATVSNARRLMEEMIIWPNEERPDPQKLKAWDLEYADGQHQPNPKLVQQMKQRLMAREEWENRALIDAFREAGKVLARKTQRGEKVTIVGMKYIADGVAMMTRDTAQAFGAAKPTYTQINQLRINAAPMPKEALNSPKPKPKKRIIDVTPTLIPEHVWQAQKRGDVEEAVVVDDGSGMGE